MTRELSLFQRWIAYLLCYLIFLQQPLVIAAELVSLERAEAVPIKLPLSRSKKKTDAPAYKTGIAYCQLVDVPEKTLRLQLSPDLEKLDSVFLLFKSSDKSKVASLQKTTDGLALQILDGYVLNLVSKEYPLPNLFVNSVGRISLDAERLVNPLTIHASSIKFLKDMKVHSPVVLWAKGDPGPREADAPEPITLTIENALGKQVLLEAKGRVQTKGLKGNGTLSIFAGEFRNNTAFLLHQIQIRAHIENGLEGDLCGRDHVLLEGTLKNRGFIRSRGDLVERIMSGGLFEHTETSRTFSLNSHKVEGTSYLHNGKVYSAGAMRVLTSVMTFGPQFRFVGNRFIGNARYSIEAPHSSTLFESLRYIEFKSTDDLDNRVRMSVHTFKFPFGAYFGDLSGLDDDQRIQYHKKSKELEAEQKYVISDENGDAGYGIFFSSSKGTIFQAGDINTSGSDILLKASHVGHDGITRSGVFMPGSVKVIAQSASLRGRIEASRRVEAHVTGSLTMDLFLKSPLTLVFANSLDLSGDLKTSLIAKVTGPVRFLDHLKAQAISVEAPSLSVLQTPGSTAGPQEIGSLQASVSTFLIQKPLVLSGPSWAQVESWFSNQGHMTINGFFEARMPGGHYLGSMDGSGTVSLIAPAFRDVVDLAFGKTRVQTDTIHVTAEAQDVVIDASHTTDRQVGLKARSLAVNADQIARGGLFLGSLSGDFTMQGITLDAADQLLSLEAMGGDFYGQGARTRSGILSMHSSGNGSFGGGIFSSPQMQIDIAGVCDTSTLLVDVLVNVPHYHEFDFNMGWCRSKGGWVSYTTETQQQKTVSPAQFLSLGLTRSGERAFQHFKVGRYEGNGVKETDSYYANDGSWNSKDRIGKRLIHRSDGPLTIISEEEIDLSRGDLRAGQTDTILLLANRGDVKTRNVLFEGGRAWQISRHGNIGEYTDVLSHHIHTNQSGTGDGHTWHTTSQRQLQEAAGNIYNLFGGRQTNPDGTEVPTLLFQVSKKKSIVSHAPTYNVPNGFIARIAPEGTISSLPVTLVNTYTQHHETRGKGFNNHWNEWSHDSREVGAIINGDAELVDCLTHNDFATNRFIKSLFCERALTVHRRTAQNHFSSGRTMTSQKDGADIFSNSGSAYFSETVNAHYATPGAFVVGHYVEVNPFPGQLGTTTWEGPIHVVAQASTLTRDQSFKAIRQTMEQKSFSQVDNCSSFTPSQYSMPQFGSHPLQMLKGFNQGASYANEALNLIKTVKSGNPYLIALEVAGKFTNFSSTESEQSMRQYEMTEAAPFLNLGRTHFDNVAQITGTLAGMTMDSPTGLVKLFDVRAPLYERTMEARSTTTTTSCNPLKLSFGQSNSWSEQSSFDRGSQHSFVNIFGRPDVRIDEYRGYGVGLNTLPTGGDQDFTQRTIKVLIDGRIIEVPYLERADASSGVPLIARPTGNRVSVGDMHITAPSYENGYSIASGHSHWGVSLLPIVLALIPGGQGLAMMTLMSSVNIGFGGENKEGYHRGTRAMSFSALGAPIDVDNLYTKGNASVGHGIHARTHHHEDVPEEHREDSSYDIAGRVLEVGTEGLSAWNNVDGLIKHYKYWTHSGPTEQDRQDLTKRLAQILHEDAEAETRERDRQTSSGRPFRASQTGDSDRDPSDGQRRGRTSTRYTDDQRSARSTVDDLNQAAYAPESDRAFIDRASDRARPQRSSSPTTFRNKERLNRAEANYEAAKDQGFIARSRASSELVEARQIYEARVDLRESLNAAAMLPSQTKDMVVDGIHYAKEHPAQAGARVAGIGLILASGGSATPFVGVGLGVAGGGLLGLASNDFRVENTQDVLNIGSSAVTGGFAPMRALSALYGARNVLSVAALTGVGIGGLGYSTGSTTMMIDGALLTGGAAIAGGKTLFSGARSGKSWTHFPSPETPNIFAHVSNRNALNPVAALGRSSTNVSSMEASIARRIAQPVANQNTALLFDVRNGTNGLSFTTRMSTEGSGIPRGFGVGRSEGVGVGSGGARAIPSGGGSSGPSQGTFIRRIDKSQAHADRMARGDEGLPPKPAVKPQGPRFNEGTAHISNPLVDAPALLRGSQANAGNVPLEIAQALEGKTFPTFNSFRSAFWKTVGQSKYAGEFGEKNIARMQDGLSPFAPRTQHLGGQKTYHLHHKTPIHAGGETYDLSNITILTPRAHLEILEKASHYGIQ